MHLSFLLLLLLLLSDWQTDRQTDRDFRADNFQEARILFIQVNCFFPRSQIYTLRHVNRRMRKRAHWKWRPTVDCPSQKNQSSIRFISLIPFVLRTRWRPALVYWVMLVQIQFDGNVYAKYIHVGSISDYPSNPCYSDQLSQNMIAKLLRWKIF